MTLAKLRMAEAEGVLKFEELRQYHRKDGQIVKEHDDLMSATRYLVMGIRHAIKGNINQRHKRKPDYDMKNKTKSSWKIS